MPPKSTCSIDGCERLIHGRQLCGTHYQRLLRLGPLPPPPPPAPLGERFWIKVQKTPECWMWTASTDSDGYGQFDHNHAHRVAWELTYDPIPPGLHVLHRCDNPPCVRPDDLFLGTPADNTRDMVEKGRWRGNGYERKTHCKRGHPFVGANLYLKPRGGRACKECHRARDRAWRARQRIGEQTK